MKKTTPVSLSVIAGIALLLAGCTDTKKEEIVTKEEVVISAPQPEKPFPSTLDPNAETDIDPAKVEFSFVFMGCNRVSKYDESNASTANVFQLQRTFNEVSTMSIKPHFFFFLGDLVLGLDTVADTLSSELKAWITQFQSPTFSKLPNSGIRLVAVPGNHEMLYTPAPGTDPAKAAGGSESKTKSPPKEELPWLKAPSVWRSLMQPFSIQAADDYGLKLAKDDDLSYSFNYKGTHFVILNTDMYSPKQPYTPGLAPASWICNDIATAKKANSKHIFVMGHKPAYIIPDASRAHATTHDDIIDTNVTDQIWPVMEKHKVEAMLSAHRHEFSVLQPKALKTYQVIAGNGGSNYEKHLPTQKHLPINNQFFGFTKIYVMTDGRVIARSFGRLTPSKHYTRPLPCDTLTRIRYNQEITWGTRSAWFNPVDSIQLLVGEKKQ